MMRIFCTVINKICLSILVFLIGITNYSYAQTKIDKQFSQHFKILDSLTKKSISDTVHTIKYSKSIAFMERHTKISSSTHGNYYGKLGYTKNDLKKWHQWYNIKYKSKEKK